MFNKNNHYPVSMLQWDKNNAFETINNIVTDSIDSFDAEDGWPCHPMDSRAGSNLYMGSAGVLWAIDYLQRVSATESNFDISPYLDNLLKVNREEFEKESHSDNASYLIGDLPILMMQYKFSHNELTADELYHAIQKNNSQPVRELLWGTAGSMLASNFMYQWTSESRWKQAYLFQANRLFDEMEYIPDIGYLWTQDLYGDKLKFPGAAHGFVGNIIPVIKGRTLLANDLLDEFYSRVIDTIINSAKSDRRFANWRGLFDDPATNKSRFWLQWCHGAPGMIIGLSELPRYRNEQFDQILEKAGELIWHAGPLKKGSNLCHGTAGNGYAFLKLFERTQNELWLERARTFAMNAIENYEASKSLFRQGRYSLWTGDLGLAIYLWDCINSQAKFPTIDVF